MLVAGLCFTSQAASSSWNIDADGLWTNTANWTAGSPGISNGTTSTDVAFFTNTLTGVRVVTVETARNVGGITFGSAGSANGITLTNGTVRLSDGGVIQSLAGMGGTNKFLQNVILQGNGTFSANSTNAAGALIFGGNQVSTVSGGTLTLDGSSTAANSVVGIVGGGAVVKNGTGIWTFNASSFTGGFTLNSGTVSFGSGTALGLGTGLVTINGGTLGPGGSDRNLTNSVLVNGNFALGNTGAKLTLSGGMNLNGAVRTITNNTSRTSIISGVVSNGGLNLAGAGTLFLSGANTYSGDTTLSAGTLTVSNSLALQNSTLVYSAGTAQFGNGSTAYTLGGLSGSKALGLTNMGGTAIALTVGNNSSNTAYSGVLSAGGSLTKTGTGALTLSGANTFTGGLTLNNGTLLVGNTAALGSNVNAVTINGGTLASASSTAYTLAQATTLGGDLKLGQASGGTGALTLSGAMDLGASVRKITVDNTLDTISGGIYGAGGITKEGAGTLVLSGTNSFTGNLTLNTGILKANNTTPGLRDGNLGKGSSALTLNGGELQLASAASVNYGRNTTVGGDVTITSDKYNAGTYGVGSTYTLGTLNIGAQTLTVKNGASVTSGVAGVNFGAATLTGAATFKVDNTGGVVSTLLTLASINNGGFTSTFNGAGDAAVTGGISGNGGLIKADAGTLTLSGVNSFTGASAINGGKLVVNGSMLSDITVNSGAVLGGSGTVHGVTMKSGSTLSAGNSPDTLTITADALLEAGSTNLMEIYSSSLYDVLKGASSNTLTMAGTTVFDFTGWTVPGVTNGTTFNLFQNWASVNTNGATFTFVNLANLGLTGTQTLEATGTGFTVIPEPATIGMLGLGALITIMLRRLRTR